MMEEDILDLLKTSSTDFLSGEELSRRLNVSRTAIWKRIRRWRSLGYEIEASPRLGYRLIRSPDRLMPAEVKPILKTRWLGRTLHYFESLDSTNRKAYELASHGAKEGEIVIAESQTKGKGRLGRSWFSPPYVNLYLSIILRPQILPQQASLITLMAAVATANAIERASGITPSIKWPNDILIRGRKVAGLLNEIQSETDRIHFIILGIGVNLNADEEMFPKELRSMATSIKREKGGTISRRDFLSLLLQQLEEWYALFQEKGNQPILEAWRERARIQGKPVRVTSFRETLSGLAIDIDSDGALLMRTETGKERRVVAGDIEYT